MSIDIDRAAEFLTALANSRRLLILHLLTKDEFSVGDLAEQVGLSQSALSQHLAKLRAAHLVSTRKDGQSVYYSCRDGVVADVLKLVLTR
ncbi:ArsR/SmtB family transcription factor [Agrobacterium pusense]|uniref:ArsR/SmtB family transcription factor n=1 Tax=Agrobacterium pusense TaxID=648995 RepID=UPI003FD52F18